MTQMLFTITLKYWIKTEAYKTNFSVYVVWIVEENFQVRIVCFWCLILTLCCFIITLLFCMASWVPRGSWLILLFFCFVCLFFLGFLFGFLFFSHRTKGKYTKALLLDYCVTFSDEFHSSEVLPWTVLMMIGILSSW